MIREFVRLNISSIIGSSIRYDISWFLYFKNIGVLLSM